MKRLLPVLLLFSLFTSGLVQTFVQGFDHNAWQKLTQPQFLKTAGFTTFYAASSAALALGLGIILALATYRPTIEQNRTEPARASRLWLAFPAITVGFLLTILASPTGIIAAISNALSGVFSMWTGQASNIGDTSTVSFQFNLVRSPSGFGIITAALIKESAFVILWVRSSLDRLDPRLILAARMFGARPLQIFREILAPVIMPAGLIAGLMVFIYALGAWELPYILGPSDPQALSLMVLESREHGDAADRSLAAAALSVLSVVSALIAWFVLAMEKKVP